MLDCPRIKFDVRGLDFNSALNIIYSSIVDNDVIKLIKITSVLKRIVITITSEKFWFVLHPKFAIACGRGGHGIPAAGTGPDHRAGPPGLRNGRR